MKTCKVKGCEKVVRTKGYCNAHHIMWLRHGDPLGGKYQRGAREKFIENLKVYNEDDCIKWPFGLNLKGYGSGILKGKATSAQREICFKVHGPPPSEDYEAAHSCGNGNKGCCNPNHIRWLTRSENQLERTNHGTSNRGTQNGQSKLNEEDIFQIRDLKKSGLTNEFIADKFSVSKEHIRDIINRKRWGWLE